ncbi:hypothetical protein [Pseudomonas shahriarae]|uniref:hypothetical protein n=1 Tax=Pseudomonas shahriarae TaxID=2745512 RepID=UPI0023625CC1|nr:hypothetical protein [Pseudomonas shahriarae]MDD1134102.1 hypothetical protein [Pseudomonas shahriarae]
MQSPHKSNPRIQRTFRNLSQEEIADIEQASLLSRLGWAKDVGWETLLESQRVLIVSEAGAGKTYECRAQQQALWEKGEPAFFLELSQLATANLPDLLSREEEERLEAWQAAQSEIATFFLDSIDELKLTLGSFEVALKRLGKAIGSQLGRVQIVITTRPVAVDQKLIQRYLPVPDQVELVPSGDNFADIATGRLRRDSAKKEDVAPVWRNVALMPLSDQQIREMAVIEGVNDADVLLADIRKRNAEDFARRPQDLVELCSDWREHRRIRTHREQVEQNIRIKLKPRTDRGEPAQLSPDKALEGASRLALAALLTRKLTIRLSVEADRGGEPGGALEPEVLLHDWTPQERETLLERALFGFASYGRVRFHHRSVLEFLAAQYLDRRLSQGMPIKAVKRLLFAETQQNDKVVRPTMRPVAAWLAASQPTIFSEVRDREPNVLLDHADPESLTLSQRSDALRSYVRLYGPGGWRGLQAPQVQIHRFASPDLEGQVLQLWGEGIENPEIRELLLDLVGAGPMPACADIAHTVAIDGLAMDGERLDAITALARLGDSRVELLTQSMEEAQALWPDSVVRGAVVRLFPLFFTPDRLCGILRGLSESSSTGHELGLPLPYSIAELEFAPGYLETLREGLTNLVTEDLAWVSEWPHLVSKRSQLLSALAAVCLRLIRGDECRLEVLRSSTIALRLLPDDHTHDEPLKNLRKALSELNSIQREAIFWSDDAFNESLHPRADSWARFCQASFRGPIQLNYEQDAAWVRRILADADRPLSERAMMLHASMRGIWDGVGDSRDHIEGLKQYVLDKPVLIALIDQYLAPPEIDPEMVKLEARIDQQRRASEERQATQHADWVAFWCEVVEHPEEAFTPDREGNTAWNLWQAMQRSGNESRASGWDRRFLEAHFGKTTADRLRTSMRAIWRGDHPTLRYERPAEQKGTFLIRWQLGLAAIAAEAEDPDWARNLSVVEAKLAARYARVECNGFPAWLESLAREFPDAVEQTLGPDLTAELNEVAKTNSFAMLLQDVSYASDIVAQLFVPRLLRWLDAYVDNPCRDEDEAAALGRLERVLKILLQHGGGETRGKIHTLAAKQLSVADNGPFTQVWLTTLMRLDPGAGADALELLLALHEPMPTGIAINAFSTLFGDRFASLRVDLSTSGFTPQLLLRLLRLAYQHVRPSDDITHEGTFSPGPRDDAQNARNALLTAILDTQGAEAWMVKIEMLADPLFAHFCDRLALLAREKAAEEVDGAVLTESEVATLNSYGEAPPTTRDDMFAVLVDRFEDLDDLLLQDVTPRDAWVLISEEKVMRREIARELRNASNHVYTVDQEAATADEKETDIRMRAISGQQATVELKLGENWSGRVLRDTIKNQLVTRYMAAECCRSGCLLVTVASERRWEHPETGELIGIEGLRELLEFEASRVVSEMGNSLRLLIKVLDLRPRLSAGSRGLVS